MRKFLAIAALLLGLSPAAADVTTHLYDNNNSGWVQNETTLNLSNVGSVTIKQTLAVDGQVEAQPLIYQGVLYIATENDTLYAFDAVTGAPIASRNFGSPVPESVSGCTNDGPMGITSTPVIDTVTGILYLVAYTYPSNVPTYTIYGVKTSDLTNAILPKQIALTATMTDSSTYTFNPTVSKQRAALKLGNGNIYVGFGSFCDFHTNQTRGWFLAFNKSTLALVVTNGYLVNQKNPDTSGESPSIFLTSIWGSGTGPSIDGSGNVYVVTGNSGANDNVPAHSQYNQTANLAESIIKFSPSLVVSDYLSASTTWFYDAADVDLGGAGLVIMPPLTGAYPAVGINIGKEGDARWINLANMGHFAANGGADNDITVTIHQGCFCNPVAFIGPDQVMRVAIPQAGNSGGAQSINVMKVYTDPVFTVTEDPNNQHIGNPFAGGFASGQLSGVYQTVSCNVAPRGGFCYPGTAVLWIITRPTGGSTNTIPPTLMAWDPIAPDINNPVGLPTLSIALANWPNIAGSAFLVPVVNNGRIYACSFKACYIFGL